MIYLLRTSVIVALLALIAVASLPLDRPHVATFPIDQPPALPILAALYGLIVLVLQAITAYGLLRFRRWAPKLAAITTILIAGLVFTLALASDLASALSVAAKAMVFVSAGSWALAVMLTGTPSIRERFEIAL